MKIYRLIPVLAMLVFVSCSGKKNLVQDDVYYSPYNTDNGKLVSSGNGSYVNSSISKNSEYDYQKYYSDSKNYVSDADPVYQTTETVTDTNGVVYTTTETYYDADFAARIKRFGSSASKNVDYYDDYYTSSGGGDTYIYINDYDPWDWSFRPYVSFYYDPFYWDWYYPHYWYRPYYTWGWGWYDYGWYHPYHHHHHHYDPYHPHHGGGGMGSYVASVRHGNSNTPS